MAGLKTTQATKEFRRDTCGVWHRIAKVRFGRAQTLGWQGLRAIDGKKLGRSGRFLGNPLKRSLLITAEHCGWLPMRPCSTYRKVPGHFSLPPFKLDRYCKSPRPPMANCGWLKHQDRSGPFHLPV